MMIRVNHDLFVSLIRSFIIIIYLIIVFVLFIALNSNWISCAVMLAAKTRLYREKCPVVWCDVLGKWWLKKEVVNNWTLSGCSICLVNSLNWYQLKLVAPLRMNDRSRDPHDFPPYPTLSTRSARSSSSSPVSTPSPPWLEFFFSFLWFICSLPHCTVTVHRRALPCPVQGEEKNNAAASTIKRNIVFEWRDDLLPTLSPENITRWSWLSIQRKS